ncbi:MAG: hypothetical protein ACE5E1_00445 [Phycisphaerae bacterium]
MHATNRNTKRFRLVAMMMLPALMVGCQAVPGPEAILAGAWELTKDSGPSLSRTILVFDDFGRLTEIRTIIGNTTVADRNVSGTATVDGAALALTTSTNLKFTGTFNADFTVATGNLFTEFTLFGVTTTTDEGSATLTKVE